MAQAAAPHGIFERDFECTLGTDKPAWLRKIRSRAMERFTHLGFPTLQHEDWRFTSLKPISDADFSLAQADVSCSVSVPRTLLDSLDLGDVARVRLVFVDGRYRPDLSTARHTIEGIRCESLCNAITNNPSAVQPLLCDDPAKLDALTALNTAFISDGACIRIGAHHATGVIIHLLLLSTAPDPLHASHPRNLVVVEEGCRATIVEHHASLDLGVHWTNTVTQIQAGATSQLAYYLLEDNNLMAFNTHTLDVRQQADSHVELHCVLLGGSLVRSNVKAHLAERCELLVNGLFVGCGAQHLDNHMEVVHAKPQSASRQFYKGVLADCAHGVFSGRIIVRPGAQKTDAMQTNRNLLLSDTAQIDTKPQLEIYADDVKCTHGATVGCIDEEAVYYLQTRGIDRATAQALMVYAFAAESLQRMKCEPMRDRLTALLTFHLPQSRELAAIF